MQYCNNCKVKIRGSMDNCPLCGNVIEKHNDDIEEVFPKIPPEYESHLAMKIMVFVSIVVIVASYVVYILIPSNINWPIFVVFGLISMWLSLIMVIKKRHNIPKNILWQVTLVTLLSLFWDWKTGWRGWSIDFVVPITYVLATCVMFITAKIMHLKTRDYLIYSLLGSFFGIIPVIFLLIGWIKIFLPTLICVAISIIFLAAIFIFQGENIRNELHRKMHI